jgi:hypothetical protein
MPDIGKKARVWTRPGPDPQVIAPGPGPKNLGFPGFWSGSGPNIVLLSSPGPGPQKCELTAP